MRLSWYTTCSQHVPYLRAFRSRVLAQVSGLVLVSERYFFGGGPKRDIEGLDKKGRQPMILISDSDSGF